MKRILIINGHPRQNSFSNAISTTYAKAAEMAGHEVRQVALRDLQFAIILTDRCAPLEPDLLHVQQDITWCQHLVIVTPLWWMQLPALMKGFFDRILTSGFAFKHHHGAPWPHLLPERLLKGKSARVIYTQDMPKILADVILCSAFWLGFKWGVLWYCGLSPVRRLWFSRVFASDEKKRDRWLKQVDALGKMGG